MTDDTGCKSQVPKVLQAQAEALRGIIEKAKQGDRQKVALFTHAFPDPDALGSMMGMAWLIERAFGLTCECFFHGEISHPQNNAIVNLLDPQLKRASEGFDPNNYGARILLDTIPSNAGTSNIEVQFDAVIDHHKDLPNDGYNGLVIHLKTGSCCSIVFKLMQHLCTGEWFQHDTDHDRKVATAMITGVITDTDYMVSDDTTEHEFDAYAGLFEFRHSDFLKKIVFYTRPKLWVDAKAAACQSADIDDEGAAIVGLPPLPESQRDLLPDMANDMVTWASVDTAISFTIINGDRVEGSVRSRNNQLNVADLCKKLGGKHGQGGGKQNKGAYRYSLGGLSLDIDDDEDIKRETWEAVKKKEIKRIRKILIK